MQETEIIKGLSCLSGNNVYCASCAYADDGRCKERVSADALDLIKQQVAELDKLSGEIDELIIAKDLLFDEAEALIKKSKSEAIKEFAERLNKEAEKVCIDREGDFVEADGEIYYTVADWCKKTSDNIVKEMVGDRK